MTEPTVSSPYADAWGDYWAAGWRGILPLPFRSKKPPPDGYTGRAALTPSYADCSTWAEDGVRNLALHLPAGVIGLDVDDYDGRGGGATLQQLVAQYGPLPATWLSTSRGDGISGIRLYRVPDGVVLPTKLPGIELIQTHHRYVVCWPSLHPEGRQYTWVDEATGELGSLPALDRLPPLPQAWIDGLGRQAQTAAAKQDLSDHQAVAIFTGFPDGTPCGHITTAAGRAALGGDRHDSYNEAVLAVCRHARHGCPGGQQTLLRLKAMFLAEVTGDRSRTPSEAQAEWMRSLRGALGLVADVEQGDACPEDWSAFVDRPPAAPAAPPTAGGDTQPPAAPDDRPDPFQVAVQRKAHELLVVEEARGLLARRHAAQAPPLDAVQLHEFLSQPDEQVAYRVDRLWNRNGRVLLAAAAKAGKTTMMTNLLGCLADGGAFLGEFDTVAVTGTIVYLNLEVSASQMRRWLRRCGVTHAERVHVVNLRGQISALTLATPDGRKRVAGWLRGLGAEVVILDPLAPLLASLGLDENSNTDIATFFSWWSSTLHDAGVVDDIVCHHAGHHNGRSRGASRLMDEPDALWTITRDTAADEDGDDIYDGAEPRFFRATGRDVEQPEQPLVFDPQAGTLSLGEGNRKALRQAARLTAAEGRVLAAIDAGNRSKRSIVKSGGRESDNSEALDSLLRRGVVFREEVGQVHVYSRTVSLSPSVSGRRESVGVSPLYKGDTTLTPSVSPEQTCRSCGDGTGHAAAVYCPECARRRTAGEDI